jgi:hypothetical protein
MKASEAPAASVCAGSARRFSTCLMPDLWDPASTPRHKEDIYG